MTLDEYKLLRKINSPRDLKQLSAEELRTYCDELRSYIIDECSVNPGHLASSLGCVELAAALHYVFDTPADKIVWDVGHQTYAHKIITGRREAFKTKRLLGGISGFRACRRAPTTLSGAGMPRCRFRRRSAWPRRRDARREAPGRGRHRRRLDDPAASRSKGSTTPGPANAPISW